MRKTGIWTAAVCCMLAAAMVAGGQSSRKAGLWEMNSTMTWQKSPIPPGMTVPQGANSPFAGRTTTTQVCVTKEMIDKYGAPVPQSRNNQCQIANVSMKGNGMTADWNCSGMMAGKGTVESSWTDSEHASSKVHFAGTVQMGPNPLPVEYTIETTSVFKSSDCGSVKPPPASPSGN